MLNFLARGVVVVVCAVTFVACKGSESDSRPDAPDKRDASQNDAAQSGDAEVSDSGAPRLMDAGEHSAADSGAHKLDSGAEKDAAMAMDSSTAPHDAGHDSGFHHVDDEDSGPADSGSGQPVSEDTFAMRVVASGLDAPWEITWGPDARLWITERTGGRVIRMDPANGNFSVALTLSDVYQAAGQDGLLGMALHPQLGRSLGNDYVYLAYTYDADASGDVDRRARIVRYAYDMTAGTLGSPMVLIEGLPASSDHNSGRLAFGPDDHLYYTIGDQGHNQFDNMCLQIRAQDIPTQIEVNSQDWSTYQGKILRLGLDGSIPGDNPTIAGVRSHVFSYGHRNAQGIAFGPGNKLYASEQGPKTDDELNLIAGGKNYGWPFIAGFRDDSAYVYGNWSASSPEACDTLSYSDYELPDSVPKQVESAWSNSDYVPPLKTFYTVDNNFQFVDPACPTNDFICWPTIAPSSLDIYVPGNDGFQTWGTALLVPSLKKGSVFRVPLSANGEATQGETKELFKTTNRYRDLTIAANKRTFYVVTDSTGVTSGPTSGSTQTLDNPGAVLEFTYAKAP